MLVQVGWRQARVSAQKRQRNDEHDLFFHSFFSVGCGEAGVMVQYGEMVAMKLWLKERHGKLAGW